MMVGKKYKIKNKNKNKKKGLDRGSINNIISNNSNINLELFRFLKGVIILNTSQEVKVIISRNEA